MTNDDNGKVSSDDFRKLVFEIGGLTGNILELRRLLQEYQEILDSERAALEAIENAKRGV